MHAHSAGDSGYAAVAFPSSSPREAFASGASRPSNKNKSKNHIWTCNYLFAIGVEILRCSSPRHCSKSRVA